MRKLTAELLLDMSKVGQATHPPTCRSYRSDDEESLSVRPIVSDGRKVSRLWGGVQLKDCEGTEAAHRRTLLALIMIEARMTSDLMDQPRLLNGPRCVPMAISFCPMAVS